MVQRTLIIIDTNFFLIPGIFGLDIFEEIARVYGFAHSIATLDKCVRELEKIAAGRGKDASAARLGLKLLQHKKVKILRSGKGKVDDLILAIAKKRKAIVATQDAVLRRRLKKAGIRRIVLRKRSFLKLIE